MHTLYLLANFYLERVLCTMCTAAVESVFSSVRRGSNECSKELESIREHNVIATLFTFLLFQLILYPHPTSVL